MIEIDSTEYALLYKQVRRLKPEAAKRMRANLSAAARPVVIQARTKILGQSSKGGAASAFRKKRGVTGGAGLRQGIARALESKVEPSNREGQTVVRIRVSASKFESASGRPNVVVRRVEGLGRWRHPVFGNRKNWVKQEPMPFLRDTVEDNQERIAEVARKSYMEAVEAVLPR